MVAAAAVTSGSGADGVAVVHSVVIRIVIVVVCWIEFSKRKRNDDNVNDPLAFWKLNACHSGCLRTESE